GNGPRSIGSCDGKLVTDMGTQISSKSPASTQGGFVLSWSGWPPARLAAAGALPSLRMEAVQHRRPGRGRLMGPGAFVVSTLLLLYCSVMLQRALGAVKRERQTRFRRSMLAALLSGALFVGVQSFGLWCIVQNLQSARNAGETQLGATALVMGAA